MSLEMYQDFKQKYETIKPIRGRAVEVRPWDKRRRDWEQIVQYTRAIDGAVMYAAKLHDTNVISVSPNGDIHFDSGGWVTPSTADFMSQVMLDSTGRYRSVCKQANAIWVYTDSQLSATGQMAYRKVSNTGGLTLTYDPATGKYDAPLTTITKKSVNRTVIKEVRHSLNKFKQFYKTFLKMSDGLLSADTIAQYSIVRDTEWRARIIGSISVPFKGVEVMFSRENYWGRQVPKENAMKLLEIAQSDDESAYVPLLCLLVWITNIQCTKVGNFRTVIAANGLEVQGADISLAPEEVDGLMETLIKQHLDVWNYKTVTVTQPTKDELPVLT
jgi:hypothetical protein